MEQLREASARPRGPFLGGWYLLVPMVALSLTREWWAPDEPRYAEIAKEAWERGSFLVLHLCDELYPDKPPLVYWLAGLFGKLSGWSEFWMRVPSLAATAGTAWITARLARRLLGELEAAWSVVFCLGTAMMLEIGGRLQLDPLLTFLCLAGLEQVASSGGDERERTKRALLAGACVGLAALAKGPPAWIHVGLALLAWACLPKPLRWRPRWSLGAWIGFAILALVPVVLWATLAVLEEPSLLKPLFFGQHIGRITEGDKHSGPLWDHLIAMPPLLFPWTLVCAAGLWRAIRAWRARDAREIGLVRCASWFVLVFVFFSLIPPKRDLYLLPIYPAAALIAASEFARSLRRERLAGWIGWTTAWIVLAVGLALVAAPLWLAHLARLARPGADLADELAPYVVPSGAVLLALALVALHAQRSGRPGRWADALGLGVAVAVTAGAVILVPAVNPTKSARELALLLRARPERPGRIACIGVRPEGIRFYGGGAAADEPLVPALAREGAQFLGLCTDENLERLAPEDRRRFTILETRRLGSHEAYVLGAAPR